MPEIRFQREDERKANEGINSLLLGYVRSTYNWFCALYANFRITNCSLFIALTVFKALWFVALPMHRSRKNEQVNK